MRTPGAPILSNAGTWSPGTLLHLVAARGLTHEELVSGMLKLALAAAMLLPATIANAGEQTPVEPRSTAQAVAPVAPRSYPQAVFDDLKKADDPKLESQRAGYWHEHYYYYHRGLSGGEVLLCVLLHLFVFPIGLIVTIVLVLTD